MSCKHHLLLDVTEAGNVKLNLTGPGGYGRNTMPRFGGAIEDLADQAVARLEEMRETCVLDVAAGGGKTLEEIGEVMGVHRERVRQIESAALVRLREVHGGNAELADWEDSRANHEMGCL